MELGGTHMIYRRSGKGDLPHQRAAQNAAGWVGDRFFRAIARAGRLHPQADPSLHGVEVIHDLSYAPPGDRENSRAHRLDVYRPTGAGEGMPTVLYIHGGAFHSLSKDTHWIMGLAYARQGYLVFVINYRVAPRHKFPAAAQDVARAFTWTVEHAADFGGDPRRVVVAGESAGANLAASLTVMACFDRPEPWAADVSATGVTPTACLPACGLLQVSDTERFTRRRSLPGFIRNQIVRCEAGYLHGARLGSGGVDLADPLLVLESNEVPTRPLPPFFALVGTRDPLLDDTRRLEAALRARGADVEAKYYPGGLHGFHAVPMLRNARRSWRDQFAFLDRVLART
ncbi:MAG: alpha/beta hydrolase [Candidatus Nanopelagicales bacterium]|nr:alpha/beta hydrolase [Candidatus Nanopelagicales bacterium]